MRFTKTTLCATCFAPSGMKLQWRMTLVTPEFTTWVGLPTHKHYILPFTSAHWLSTQLDFKTISGHWIKIVNQRNSGQIIGAQCRYLLSSNRFLSVNTSREMTHQVWLCYKQINQLIAMKPNMTGKVTFCVCFYLECVVEKWNETEFTTQAVHKMYRVRL